MNAPGFTAVDARRVASLATRFREQGTRSIDAVHLHVTARPSMAEFEELVDEFGNRSRLAGEAVCKQLWERHTRLRGWAHIGVHLLIDPRGRVWIGRAWDLPPVSVSGYNGNAARGPLSVALIGDIGSGQQPTTAQRSSLVKTLAGLLDGLSLAPDTLRQPGDLGVGPAPPPIDPGPLMADVERSRAGDTATASSAGGQRPLGEREDDVHRLLDCLLDDASRLPPAVRRLEAASNLDEPASTDEEPVVGRGARGGSPHFSLTPQLRRRLKRHVINLRQGEFSTTGDFCTTAADLDALIERSLIPWIQARQPGDPPPRVLIHAHGGLNREEAGLGYAAALLDWWLGNGIYPIFFVWETGLIESLLQLLEEKLGGTGRGIGDDLRNAVSEKRDSLVESLIRQVGTDLWNIMKSSAQRASEKRPNRGAFQLAKKLDALRKDHPQLEFHAIGHSAGAIFQAYFLPKCYSGPRKVTFESVSLLAPACTVDLFQDRLLKRVDGKRIKRLNLFNLDVAAERRDPTVPMYGKSLLHLVSNGFEGRRNTPVLGMEQTLDADRGLAISLGLGSAQRPDINVVFSPTGEGAPDALRAAATTHGGLSSDPVTLASLARLILPPSEAHGVTEPRLVRGSRGVGDRLFEPLASRLDADTYAGLFRNEVPAAVPVPMQAADASLQHRGAATSVPPSGVRRALCIGIDDYPGSQRLQCCVSDAMAWQRALQRLDFEVDLLLDSAATQAGIIEAMTRTIAAGRAGDVIAIQFSGHGIQFPDSNGDEEDGHDEALVPYASANQYFISDDTLWEILQSGSPGVHLYVFMDCCHSRSNSRAHAPASRSEGRRARRIVPSEAAIQAHRVGQLASRGARGNPMKPIESMRHVKFSACHDREEAFEEKGQGNFTRAALAALDGLVTELSNESMRLAIEESFPPDARQHPGLECPTSMKRLPFFAGLRRG